MQVGDISVVTDDNGHESVVIVCKIHGDGSIDLHRVRPDLFGMTRSSRPHRPGTVYDPNLLDDAQDSTLKAE